MKFNFPENLYTEVRIEEFKSANFSLKDKKIDGNSEICVNGVMIRIFDGKMWFGENCRIVVYNQVW